LAEHREDARSDLASALADAATPGYSTLSNSPGAEKPIYILGIETPDASIILFREKPSALQATHGGCTDL
jgi:hypothetical protein